MYFFIFYFDICREKRRDRYAHEARDGTSGPGRTEARRCCGRSIPRYKEDATMADISLYLTNVNVSIGRNMDMRPVGSLASIITAVSEVIAALLTMKV